MWYPDDKPYSQRSYLAPTVYLDASKYVSNWLYYASFEQARLKWLYLRGNADGSASVPAGVITFQNNRTAQTLGINCDFYMLKDGTWQLTSYGYLRTLTGTWPPIIYRFFTVDGAGPYYAILDRYYFGLSASAIDEVSADKLAALDALYREVQLMKYRYNSLVGFLNSMAARELNSVEQRIFNEGLLLLNSLQRDMQSVRGIEVAYQKGSTVGIPVIAIIVIIAILAGATAWSVTAVNIEKEKTKQINDSYELQKWVANRKIEVAQLAERGEISAVSADSINRTLDAAARSAQQVAQDAAKDKGIFGNIATILQWGVIGYLGYLFLNRNKQ